MKHFTIRCISFMPVFILAFLLLQQCNQKNDNIYQSLMTFADQIQVINTHEHQHWPEEYGDLKYGLFHLIRNSYLMSDVASAGGTRIEMETMDSMSIEELWLAYGQALDYTRSSSYYGHFIKGFQKLYDFKDLYFTESNIHDLSAQVTTNYADYREWFDVAFKKAGFELMFLDQYWKPFNTEMVDPYYALVFHINPLVMQSGNRPEEGENLFGIYEKAEEEGFNISSFDEYLKYCDHLFKKNVSKNAVCVKNSMAYYRTQYFEDVPIDIARDLFARPSGSLTTLEAQKIQDFMFHWIIQKSIEYDLPIQIHTGYLDGNGNVLDNSKPIKFNNLFLKYPEAKFVLFHGGYPWTGEYVALGKMFPNVYLDMVWLPQISREEAVHTLDEMFDCVPYNKIFWGGDCTFIEESVGSLEFGKNVVSEVLTKRIERGLLTEDVAQDMLLRIFRENAIEVFQLEKRLGKEF